MAICSKFKLKVEFLSELSLLTGARSAVIWPDGPAVPFCRELVEKFGKHSLDGEGESMTFAMTAYQAVQSRVVWNNQGKSVLLL